MYGVMTDQYTIFTGGYMQVLVARTWLSRMDSLHWNSVVDLNKSSAFRRSISRECLSRNVVWNLLIVS